MVKKVVRKQGERVVRSVVKDITGDEPVKKNAKKQQRYVRPEKVETRKLDGWKIVGTPEKDADLILMEK